MPPREEPTPDDDVWVILHTSGTTAAPKPVALTYGELPGERRCGGREPAAAGRTTAGCA